jgi:hypothetical protein
MTRHPRTLHSVVLDSAYPRHDLDPFYASSGEAVREALELTSPGSVQRLGALLARVRSKPIAAATRDADGSRLDVRVDARALVDMVQDSASDPVVLREFDASVRAASFGPKLGADVRIVKLRNTVHVTSQGGTYLLEGMRCARVVIRSFLRARPARSTRR